MPELVYKATIGNYRVAVIPDRDKWRGVITVARKSQFPSTTELYDRPIDAFRAAIGLVLPAPPQPQVPEHGGA